MTETNTVETETTEAVAPAATDEGIISVQDLYDAVKIIDAACVRGVWKGEEMSFVGGVRDKIVRFLQPHLVNSDTPATPADGTTEVPTEEAGPVAVPETPAKAKPKAKPKAKK